MSFELNDFRVFHKVEKLRRLEFLFDDADENGLMAFWSHVISIRCLFALAYDIKSNFTSIKLYNTVL